MLKDQDIREPLFDFFDEKFGKVRIIEEKQIAKSRADVMLVLEEKLIGVEIKSDADTYARLARQVKDYNKFFDYNYVVVGATQSILKNMFRNTGELLRRLVRKKVWNLMF